jgi:hypothetical protein
MFQEIFRIDHIKAEYKDLDNDQKSWVDIVMYGEAEVNIVKFLKEKIDSLEDGYNPLICFNPFPRMYTNTISNSYYSLMNIAARNKQIVVLDFLIKETYEFIKKNWQNKIYHNLHTFLLNSNPMLEAIELEKNEVIEYLLDKNKYLYGFFSNQTEIRSDIERNILFSILSKDTLNISLIKKLIENKWFDPGYVHGGRSYLASFLHHCSAHKIAMNEELEKTICLFISNSKKISLSYRVEGQEINKEAFLNRFLNKKMMEFCVKAIKIEEEHRNKIIDLLKSELTLDFSKAIKVIKSKYFIFGDNDENLLALEEGDLKKISETIDSADFLVAQVLKDAIQEMSLGLSPAISLDQIEEAIENISKSKIVEIFDYLYFLYADNKTFFRVTALDKRDDSASKEDLYFDSIFSSGREKCQHFVRENMPFVTLQLMQFLSQNMLDTSVDYTVKLNHDKPCNDSGKILLLSKPIHKEPILDLDIKEDRNTKNSKSPSPSVSICRCS